MPPRSFLLPPVSGPATYHLFQNVLKAVMQGIRHRRQRDLGVTLRNPAEDARLVQRRPGAPRSVVRLAGPRGPVELGGRAFVVMAGPCAVEGASQVEETARAVSEAGCAVLRGGAFKPRTSPYAFQGLGAEGARLLFDSAQRNGLATVDEVMEPAQLPSLERAALLQAGARNMQNFTLLQALARSRRPVLLKRGPAATVEEWLLAAEYLIAGCKDQVVLLEPGLRPYQPDSPYV